jgi:FkbM family methyltransferase
MAIGPVRALLTRPAVERRVALVNRSAVVARGRARFLARELLGRREEALYAVRGTPAPVLVRHGSADVATLDDVFLSLDYEVPAPADAALRTVGPALRVLDLGANAGYFGAFVLGRWPGARLTSVEADPRNVRALRRTVAAAPGAHWRVVEAAAADRAGTLAFVQALFSTAHVAREGEPGETVEVPAIDALELIAEADLVKIDVEGSEWPLLLDPRFRASTAGVRAIVVEYHPEGCPEADPLAAAQRILQDAGYATRTGSSHPGGQGVIWGWRPAPAPSGDTAPPP